ncbi:MAG: CBS domain-containing protein [Deltaproteobacteria bacterium]|nr:CBS domain-containing protein [Deltaproteobacteria bacterium]
MVPEETPTLRLTTLRRLVRSSEPPLIVAASTKTADVSAALKRSPRSTAVIVDEENVLQGTARLADLTAASSDDPIALAMSTTTPQLMPENDVESARLVMDAQHTDRVLVVSSTGGLVGVVTRSDLGPAR